MPKLISAVMVTGHKPERRPLAELAVAAFIGQKYQPMELVIMNAGPSFKVSLPNLYDVPYSQAGKTLGEVREAAHQYCQGEWVIFWDDDDYHHWGRTALQAQAAGVNLAEPEADCCVLKNQLRYSFELDIAVAWEWPAGNVVPGGPGTMLYRRAAATKPFRPVGKHEDTAFILDNFAPDRVVAVTNAPETYVRFYHGHNTHDRGHIMGPLHIAANRGGRFCTPEAKIALQDLLEGPYAACRKSAGKSGS